MKRLLLLLTIATAACSGCWATCPPDPMIVSLDRSTVDPEVIWDAVDRWNEAAGWTVLRVDGPGHITMLKVRRLVGGNCDGAAACAWDYPSRDGIIRRCKIETTRDSWHVNAHELGHCLGLGHDSVKGSLMNRVAGTEFLEYYIEHLRKCSGR